MSQPAQGEDAAIDRALAKDRAAGWTWNDCRCGIIAKTPPNSQGKHATTIWYGCHIVTCEMYWTRPTAPKEEAKP